MGNGNDVVFRIQKRLRQLLASIRAGKPEWHPVLSSLQGIPKGLVEILVRINEEVLSKPPDLEKLRGYVAEALKWLKQKSFW